MHLKQWMGALLLAISASATAQDPASTRKIVSTQADLPRHSYALTAPSASALLEDDAAFATLAAQVRADTEATLRDYDIRDQNAQADLYAVLRNLALLRGDAAAEYGYGVKIRALQSKPAAQRVSSLLQDAAATAQAAAPDARAAAYRQALTQAIEPMPWAVVRNALKDLKGRAETPNLPLLVRADLKATVDPAVKTSGRLSDESARRVIGARTMLRSIAPYNPDTVAVIGGYITRHQAASADIWPARQVTLNAARAKAPVLLAVWDEGVDVALFPQRVYTNAAEKPDGRDDDGNGFVDDIHGIAFDEKDRPSTGPMLDFNQFYPGREAELRELAIGHSDAGADRQSSAAAAYRRRAATLKPEEVAPLMQAGVFYDGYYSHGTHVAGIAMDGNPAARLLVVRYNSDGYHTKPPALTADVARRYVSNVETIVAYMRARKVRVVNMSFGLSIDEIEHTLEANNIGATPAERTQMAVQTLGIVREAFTHAMESAPEILFVAAAGNSNTNLAFSPDVPAGIALPNVLAVGAVDQAGAPASFTSYGKQIAVYANGYEVDSLLPGGFHERKSGTSMAAPQVTNLAAKLFALKPSLTPAQCIALIRQGATPSADGKLPLIDSKRTVALLNPALHTTASTKEISP